MCVHVLLVTLNERLSLILSMVDLTNIFVIDEAET